MSKNLLSSSFIFLCLFILISTCAYTQQKSTTKQKTKKVSEPKSKIKADNGPDEKTTLSKEESEEYKQKISRLISFLEFALNIVGSDSSAAEDKEVIIKSSYLKFFKDSKVQIEDDLDESRKVVTFKSVQAYLHDVDYFFSNANFELSIDEITPYLNDKSNAYFIVGITRYLKGTNSDGDTIKNSKKRFVEINLGVKDKDLKIASIYSTKYNESKDIEEWWKSLPESWKAVFRKEMGNTADTINYGQVKRILGTEDLNIAGNDSIQTIEPLNKLTRLKTLNISNTKITDLTPLRNLIFLEILNCSNTGVASLDKLKYTTELKELYINNTPISSLEPALVFTKLEKIDVHQTSLNSLAPLGKLSRLNNIQANAIPVNDFAFLTELKNVTVLNLSETGISGLEALSSLEKLNILNISSTKVTDLAPLAVLKNLKELLINNTAVNTLHALKDVSGLEKIYCDHSSVSKDEAKQFMMGKPGTLVIFESEGRLQWWNTLGPEWKSVFQKYVPVKEVPSMEQLAAISNIMEINLSGNTEIKSLEPLSSINNLKTLLLNNTSISSLEPLKGNSTIEILEISDTKVNDIEVLSTFAKLKRVNLDNTPVSKTQIDSLKSGHPNCIIVYKTQDLNSWWAGVPDAWRAAFKKHLAMDALPTSIQLHQLVALDSVSVSNDSKINDLAPLKEFENLKILLLYNTSVTSLETLQNFVSLLKLGCSKCPVKSLNALTKLTQLGYLDFENTGVEDLEPIKNLKNLKVVKFSGTPVDDLKYLAALDKLTYLDCSSTGVSNLKPLDAIHTIVTLKCYNTHLSAKKIDKFKTLHPDCEVVYY